MLFLRSKYYLGLNLSNIRYHFTISLNVLFLTSGPYIFIIFIVFFFFFLL